MPYPPQGSGGGAGGGDMTKAVYDTNSDNITDKSAAAVTAGSLPANAQGKVIYLTSDDHIYVST